MRYIRIKDITIPMFKYLKLLSLITSTKPNSKIIIFGQLLYRLDLLTLSNNRVTKSSVAKELSTCNKENIIN